MCYVLTMNPVGMGLCVSWHGYLLCWERKEEEEEERRGNCLGTLSFMLRRWGCDRWISV